MTKGVEDAALLDSVSSVSTESNKDAVRTCSLMDGKPAKARGWCAAHWARWKRLGDPEGRLERPSPEVALARNRAGLCECGCGDETKVVGHTSSSRGLIRGEYNRFLHGHSAFMPTTPPGKKICMRCRQEKDLSNFRPNSRGSRGVGAYCNPCEIEYQAEWYIAKRNDVLESQAKKRAINPDGFRSIARRSNSRFREQIVKFLGGECVRCGEKDWHLLEVDHVNDDGRQHKDRKLAIRKMRDGELPKEMFQLLCANCHTLKTKYRHIYDTIKPKARKNFDFDLAYGKSIENVLAGMFTGETLVETKSDKKSSDTGNVFIELSSRGKPGGIRATTAEWWAQHLAQEDTFVIMRTERMKRLVAVAIDKRGTVRGGDALTSEGCLVKVIELVKPVPILEEEND